MKYHIDATDKVLGRLASEVALLLRGKNDPRFSPAKPLNNTVEVVNTDKIRVTGKKLKDKLYRRHSGYHGGLKEESLKTVMELDSRLALRRAVEGMLPKNKWRSKLIKNLVMQKIASKYNGEKS